MRALDALGEGGMEAGAGEGRAGSGGDGEVSTALAARCAERGLGDCTAFAAG